MNLGYRNCQACGKRIVFVRTPGGKSMPLDAAPNSDGNVVVYQQQDGRWLAVVDQADVEPPVGVRMMPHFATCPKWKKP